VFELVASGYEITEWMIFDHSNQVLRLHWLNTSSLTTAIFHFGHLQKSDPFKHQQSLQNKNKIETFWYVVGVSFWGRPEWTLGGAPGGGKNILYFEVSPP
jgi:hypothetical protein